MAKIFIFLFFIILTISLASAFSFSPASISVNLKPNQQECQKVTITSDSDVITLSDSWANTKDQDWSVSGFKADSSSHDISIDYPSSLSKSERDFDVCISGGTLGEYHGVLVLKEEQVGNSIIQMGIWLKVIISETGKISVTPVSDTTTTSGNSGSGGSGNTVKATEVNSADDQALKNQEAQLSLKVNEVPDENNGADEGSSDTGKNGKSGITGSVIGSDNSFTFNWDRILIGFIVAAAGFVAVAGFRKKYRRNY